MLTRYRGLAIAYVDTMKRVRAVVLTGVALGAPAGLATLAASGGAHGGSVCGPLTARTLASSSHARVYALGAGAFGCAAGGRKSFRLGGTSTCIGADRVGPIVVAGEIAAFASERCGVDTGSTQVLVRNLRDGKHLSASEAAASPGPESLTSVDSLGGIGETIGETRRHPPSDSWSGWTGGSGAGGNATCVMCAPPAGMSSVFPASSSATVRSWTPGCWPHGEA